MLVTPEFVFVHVPRAGGSFVRQILGERFRADPAIDPPANHAPYRELPSLVRDRPAFYVIRNPWDWYVSWYHYMQLRAPAIMGDGGALRTPAQRRPPSQKRLRKQAMWTETFRCGSASFGEVVASACRGTVASEEAPEIAASGLDTYSYAVWNLTERGVETRTPQALRFESLRPSLEEFLAAHRLLTDSLRRSIAEQPLVNASQHRPYRDYYDPELRDLVGRHARSLIERYGYSF